MAGTQGLKFTREHHAQMVKLTNDFNREVVAAVNNQINQQIASSTSVVGTFGGAFNQGLNNYKASGIKINGLITQINDAVTKAGGELDATGSEAGTSQNRQAVNLEQPKLNHLNG